MSDEIPDHGATELQHPRFGRAYARAVEFMNARGATEHGRTLLTGLAGNILEIGAGDGSTFALYPSPVTSVLAVEPDDYLRSLARTRAATAATPITVIPGTTEKLPTPDGSLDAVVVSLVLCSVADQRTVRDEVRRVLRPSGTLAFYEHVRSTHRLLDLTEDMLSPLWQRLAGGCHPNRDTLHAITDAGFDILDIRRFGFSVHPLAPPVAHILGDARRP